MSLLSLSFAFACLTYAFFGFYILFAFRKSGESIHKVFFILCIVFSAWTLNHAFLVSAADKNGCWFWYKMCVPYLSFFPSLILHFFIVLSVKPIRLKRWIYIAIYAPCFVFLYRGFTGIFTIANFIEKPYGWELIHTVGSPWYIAYTIYYITALVISVTLAVMWYRRTGSMREKKQARIIIITAMITTLLNVATQTVLPGLGHYTLPQTGQSLTLIWFFGIWYAMTHYKLMEISPFITIDEILGHINNIVIILDPGLRIISANPVFLAMFGISAHNVKNMSLIDIVSDRAETRELFGPLIRGTSEQCACRLIFSKNSGTVTTDAHISRITDRFRDLIGFLVVARENRSKKFMQTAYRITKREFEIVDLCISGFSNRQISGKLDISEKTVEAHINNIFNKCNISNRISLINLVHELNVSGEISFEAETEIKIKSIDE